MKIRIHLFICLIAIIGCKGENEKKTTKSKKEQHNSEIISPAKSKPEVNISFSDYLKIIEFIELPYSSSCDGDYPNYPIIKQELKDKYAGGDMESPYRRIRNNYNLEIVLNMAPADVELPVIKTYKKNGEVIASQQLFFGYCGGEPGYFHKEHIVIEPNLIIKHIDSTWTHKVDSLDNEIEGTEKLEIDNFEYKILETGEIKKMNK